MFLIVWVVPFSYSMPNDHISLQVSPWKSDFHGVLWGTCMPLNQMFIYPFRLTSWKSDCMPLKVFRVLKKLFLLYPAIHPSGRICFFLNHKYLPPWSPIPNLAFLQRSSEDHAYCPNLCAFCILLRY